MTRADKAMLDTLKANFDLTNLEIVDTLGRALNQAAMIVEADAKRNLKDGRHVATGLLRASLSHRLILTSKAMSTAEVGTNVEYAAKMEFGSAPGELVPITNLVKWLKRKGYSAEDAKDAAYPIQQAIFEKGTRPYPFLMPALNKNRQRIIDKVTQVMKAGIKTIKGPKK